MTERWKDDLGASATGFKNIVWPEIKCWFGDGELIPVEGVNKDFYELQDQVAGIDFWVVKSDIAMVSIASRVQQSYNFSSFTVRYRRPSGVDTEHQKRKEQVNNGYDYPTYTVQAYVEPTLEVLLNAACVRTDQFYNYIQAKEPEEPGTDWPLIEARKGSPHFRPGEEFYPVWWADLNDAENVDLTVYDRDEAGLSRDRPSNPDKITAWSGDNND